MRRSWDIDLHVDDHRNPRRFAEKYKELSPDKYPETVAPVRAAGKAPAGTHPMKTVAVVGAGPAGLRAAEVASSPGTFVTVFDAMPSPGRKFLVAGRGGLNITHEGDIKDFATRYLPPDPWPSLLADFDASALRAWAADLGVETFAASTGRVYPREMKAAPLLRSWLRRLRESGVAFAMRRRWTGLQPGAPVRLAFETPGGPFEFTADAVILACGGASWPVTGSDGRWVTSLSRHGVTIPPLIPANCGWDVAWPHAVRDNAGGLPLKNIVARAGDAESVGELLITRHGLEGGAIYQLTPALRAMVDPVLHIDLKPGLAVERLVRKMGPSRVNLIAEASTRWRLGPAATAIIHGYHDPASVEALAHFVKSVRIPLVRPRPIAEAISSGGGVAWSELDENLMIRSLPGVFCAGEMIDWEAPTGGYLMQGCFATGTRAGTAAGTWSPATTQSGCVE